VAFRRQEEAAVPPPKCFESIRNPGVWL